MKRTARAALAVAATAALLVVVPAQGSQARPPLCYGAPGETMSATGDATPDCGRPPFYKPRNVLVPNDGGGVGPVGPPFYKMK